MIFGTRPEAIKMCNLFDELKKEESFNIKLCVSGQHRSMLDQVLSAFNMKPDIDLNIMKPDQDLFDVTSNSLLAIRDVIKKENPNLILVHGDTSTALSAAIAGFYSNIDIGHVEAGLRTYNMKRPFPEEFNRQTIAKISSLNFAPTQSSKANLQNDNVNEESIHVTGNTVIDALFYMLDHIQNSKNELNEVQNILNSKLDFDWTDNKFILITGHRRENFGKGFIEICEAIKYLAEANKDINFVYPVHLNPNVKEPVLKLLSDMDNISLIEPLDYKPFIFLLKHCFIVLTDSGGIQEEAPSLGKPVLVMRDETERPEAVDAGTVKLVGASKENIISAVTHLLTNSSAYNKMSNSINPYGDGNASLRIVKIIREYLS
tara:strand:- start:8 stop:1132 length:1125 start_codon:yes stop_codon:yes gene_type:complete